MTYDRQFDLGSTVRYLIEKRFLQLCHDSCVYVSNIARCELHQPWLNMGISYFPSSANDAKSFSTGIPKILTFKLFRMKQQNWNIGKYVYTRRNQKNGTDDSLNRQNSCDTTLFSNWKCNKKKCTTSLAYFWGLKIMENSVPFHPNKQKCFIWNL